jgi:hypothetical protein
MTEYEEAKERAKDFWRAKWPLLLLIAEEDRETFVASVFVEFAATETKRVLEALQDAPLKFSDE